MTAEGEGAMPLAEAFVIPVRPFEPQEHEKMAWAAFLSKVNLSARGAAVTASSRRLTSRKESMGC